MSSVFLSCLQNPLYQQLPNYSNSFWIVLSYHLTGNMPVSVRSSRRVTNTNTISLTGVPSKTSEHIITSQFMRHLGYGKKLNHRQQGFRRNIGGRVSYWADLPDIYLAGQQERGRCHAIVLNFSKALDKFDHAKIVEKLCNIIKTLKLNGTRHMAWHMAVFTYGGDWLEYNKAGERRLKDK